MGIFSQIGMSYRVLHLCLLISVFVIDKEETWAYHRTRRIVGGKDAESDEFPYQVSLRYYGLHICGGALISPRYVLTAGHCVCGLLESPYEELTVVTGTTKLVKGSGETHTVKNVSCHPEHVDGFEDTWINDVVLITLSKNVTLGPHQWPVALPSSDTPGGVKAVLSGWGRLNVNSFLSKNLRKVTVTTLDNDVCQNYYNNTILPSQICTFESKNVGACKGDSGSPLVHNGELVGIFSWTKPCALGSPDVYTRVYYFMDFITDVICNNSLY